MSKVRDLTGQSFGRLKVAQFAGLRADGKHKRAFWLCDCTCGNTTTVNGRDLKRGHTKSCGCAKRESHPAAVESATKHGMRDTPEYTCWRSMKKRCLLESNASYSRYGARGISIDLRWIESFENFFADMGPRPSPAHSLDRRDNNGPYTKDNCRWATAQVQQSNRSDTIKVIHEGEEICLAELDRRIGAPYPTAAHYYINGKGLSVEEYVTTLQARWGNPSV